MFKRIKHHGFIFAISLVISLLTYNTCDANVYPTGCYMEPVQVQVVEPVVEETIDIPEPEPEMYVEIVNGYITEESLHSICVEVGKKYDISPNLLQAIAYVESTYNISSKSNCNAQGLCQIIPKWHKEKIQRLGITDIYEPYSNVLLCADILTELKGLKHGDDINYVLMAYNLGPSGANKVYEQGRLTKYPTKVLNKYNELELKGERS